MRYVCKITSRGGKSAIFELTFKEFARLHTTIGRCNFSVTTKGLQSRRREALFLYKPARSVPPISKQLIAILFLETSRDWMCFITENIGSVKSVGLLRDSVILPVRAANRVAAFFCEKAAFSGSLHNLRFQSRQEAELRIGAGKIGEIRKDLIQCRRVLREAEPFSKPRSVLIDRSRRYPAPPWCPA